MKEFNKQSSVKLGYKKSLVPTNEELHSLPLNPGVNTITFIVKSSMQGTAVLSSRIYLWDYTTKIILSDVDGTVTKSDFLGHLLPKFGKDWSH